VGLQKERIRNPSLCGRAGLAVQRDVRTGVAEKGAKDGREEEEEAHLRKYKTLGDMKDASSCPKLRVRRGFSALL
jgi:hypothetical protein